jgi:hypothetical protein
VELWVPLTPTPFLVEALPRNTFLRCWQKRKASLICVPDLSPQLVSLWWCLFARQSICCVLLHSLPGVVPRDWRIWCQVPSVGAHYNCDLYRSRNLVSLLGNNECGWKHFFCDQVIYVTQIQKEIQGVIENVSLSASYSLNSIFVSISFSLCAYLFKTQMVTCCTDPVPCFLNSFHCNVQYILKSRKNQMPSLTELIMKWASA